MGGEEDVRSATSVRSGISRRRLLSNLSAAGFSALSVAHITAEDVKASASDQVPIVAAMAREDQDRPHESMGPVVRNVPADWYERVQEARQVKRDVMAEFAPRSQNASADANAGRGPGKGRPEHAGPPDAVPGKHGVVSVGIDAGSYGGDNPSVGVQVTESAAGEARGVIPERRGNVPIEVGTVPDDERGRSHARCEDCASDPDAIRDDYTVPGGVAITTDHSNGATLTGAVYGDNGNSYYATAAHLFEKRYTYTGQECYHPCSGGDYLGEVTDAGCNEDVVFITPFDDTTGRQTDSPDPESAVQTESYKIPIYGQFTLDGLDDHKASGYDLSKSGCTTGTTNGKLKHTDAWVDIHDEGCLFRNHQVLWGQGSDVKSGDSGAPTYANPGWYGPGVLMANVHSYEYPLWGYDWTAGGTGAYHIYGKHGYHF